MTVMDAARTGGIEIAWSQTPQVDAIVSRLAPPVWDLLSSADLPPEVSMAAALALLKKAAPAFHAAWREEVVGIRTPIDPVLVEGDALALPAAPAVATDTGTVVRIVSEVGSATVTRPRRRKAS